MPEGIGQEFIERTKYKYLHTSEQEQGLPQPPLEVTMDTSGPEYPLPDPAAITTPIKSIIDQRASVRLYTDTSLSQEELSYLLWCTQGIKRSTPSATFRTVPSAGARHAFETFLLVNRVSGLVPGIYHYRPANQSIQEYLAEADLGEKLASACLDQEFIQASAATFIWVAVVERMIWRYEARGYRYLFLDAGHVCENLYLAAESIGCGACAIAAYEDDAVNGILHLDGVRQFVIYIGTVGKKR